jgi:hypothetical protein
MPADNENLYGEDAPPQASAPNSEPKPDDEKGDSEYKSVLIPKDFCGNEMKPGDTFQARVEQVLEDQYEVCYEPEDKPQEETPDQPPAAPASPQGGGMSSGLYE